MLPAFALLPFLASAQGQGPLRQWLSDEKQIWTAPVRIERSHLPWLAAFGAGTLGLIALDNRLLDGLPATARQLRWGGRVSRTGSFLGVLGISGGLYLAGSAAHKDKLKATGFEAAEAALHAFIVTYGLKAAFARERPGTGSGDGRFFSAHGRVLRGDTSFPSGHAMTSWALASVVAHEYGGRKLVPLVAYGFASAVSGARVAARKHHPSDVFAGGAAGYVIGRFVSRSHRARTHAAWRPQVAPSFDPVTRSAGIGLTWALTR